MSPRKCCVLFCSSTATAHLPGSEAQPPLISPGMKLHRYIYLLEKSPLAAIDGKTSTDAKDKYVFDYAHYLPVSMKQVRWTLPFEVSHSHRKNYPNMKLSWIHFFKITPCDIQVFKIFKNYAPRPQVTFRLVCQTYIADHSQNIKVRKSSMHLKSSLSRWRQNREQMHYVWLANHTKSPLWDAEILWLWE